MHIEKNVCNAIVGTLMNISGKTKDVKAVRDYFESKGLRLELWPQVIVGKKRKRAEEVRGSDKGKSNKKKMSNVKNYLLQLAKHCPRNISRHFVSLCMALRFLGYSSNMKIFVTVNSELKLGSMKSHDFHVMMQVFLPIAIREYFQNM